MDLPLIGRPAPTFTEKAVLSDKVFDISLSDYDDKYVVLLFFPMNFSYVCPTELIAFSDHTSDFQEMNTHVLGCAIESHFSHLKWLSMPRKEGGIRGLRIPLIADKSMSIARKYGVLNEEEGIAHRAMFIIDDKGILRQITVNDRTVGRSISETCRLIKDIKHADTLRKSTPKTGFPEVLCSTNTHKSRSSAGSERNLLRELTE